MNELQAYVDSLPSMLLEEEKKKLVKQWKIDNKWGEKKPEPVGTGTVLKAEEADEAVGEDFKPFDLAKIKDGVKSASAPSVKKALDTTGLASEDGSLELKSSNESYNIDGTEVTKDEFDIYTEKQKNKKPKSESGELSSWDSIKNTLVNTGNQIKGVADFWGITNLGGVPGVPINPLGAGRELEDTNPALDIATNTVYSMIFGQENVDKFVNWAGEDNFFTEGLGSKSTLKDIERLKEKKAETLPTKGIIESFEQGDAGGVIAGGINAVSSIIGSLAVNTGTAGTGFFMDYTADNYISYNEQKAKNLGVSLDELITSGKADTAAPVGMAAVSQGLEVFALGKILKSTKGAATGEIKSSGVVKNLNKYLGDKLIYNKTARTTVSALSTPVTEFSTEVLQFASDKVNEEFGRVAGTDDVAAVGKVFIDAVTSKEGLEGGIQGAFGAGSMTAGGYSFNALQTLRGVVSTVDVEQEINNLTTLRNKQREVEDGTLKEGIQIEIDNIESKISDAVNKGNKLYNNLEEGDISKLESLSDLQDASAFKVTELNKKLRAGKITQESYDLAVAGFKSEFKKARFEINTIATNAEAIKKGAGVAISQLGAGVERVDNTEDFMSSVSSLEAQGVKANINRNEAGEILPAEEQDYGIFAKVPNEEGGFDVQLVINDASSKADGILPADKHELLHVAAMKMDDASKVKMGGDILNSLLNDSNIEINKKTRRLLRAYELELDEGDITVAEFFEEVMAITSDGLTPSSKTTGVADIRVKDVSKFKAIGQKILQAIGWRQNFSDGQQAIDFLKDFNADVLKGKGLSQEVLSKFDTETDKEVDMGLNDDAVDLGTVKKSKKLTTEQDQKAQTKVKEIQELQEEGEALAKKFNKPFAKSAKQQRLEAELAADIKPTVDSFVESRTKALYDPIAPDAKKNVTRQEFVESMKSDITTMVNSEFLAKQPLEKFITSRGYLRANSLAERLGIKSVEEGITQGMEAAADVAAEDTTIAKKTKDTSSKIKPSSFISNEAVTKIREQVQSKIEGIDPKNLTFKKLGDLAPEIIAAEIGIPVKKLTVPTANLSKGDATAIQQFVNKNADKLLKILPEGAVVEAATDKLLGTSTGVPKGLLNAFYTKQARLGKGAGLAPFKLNKGISKADFLEKFGIVEGKKAEGFDARSPQAQALKGIAGLYGKLVTNEIVRSDTDLSLEAKQDVAAGKNKAMASKKLDTKSKFNTASTTKTGGVSKANNVDPISRGSVEYMGGKGGLKTETRWTPSRKDIAYIPTFMNKAASLFGKDFFTTGNFAFGGRSLIGTRPDLTKTLEGAVYNEDAPNMPKRKPYKKTKKYDKNFHEKLNTKEFIDNEKAKMPYLKFIFEQIQTDLKSNPIHLKYWEAVLNDAQNSQGHFMRFLAPIAFYPVDKNGNPVFDQDIVEEHTMPQSNVAAFLLQSALDGNIEQDFGFIEDNYFQGALLLADDKKTRGKDYNYISNMGETFLESDNPSSWMRYNNESVNANQSGIDFNAYKLLNGQTIAESLDAGLPLKDRTLDALENQRNEILKQLKDPSYKAKEAIEAFKELAPGKVMASKRDSNLIPDAIKYDRPITVQTAVNALEKTDIALSIARIQDQPVLKIRVFDFDDTLARTKSNVLYTMPDGTTGKIDAATFAKEAGNMEAEGAKWDFSEFSKVMQGSKGPLLDVAKIIADKRGTKDVFVLTARPANAAGPIKEFLASMGLDIPLANITGLGDGTPQAKAGWIMGKAAEGYNDFYFADDHTGNVKAVKDVLSQIDVKSKVQLAKASKRQTFDTVVNDMIEDSSGIEAYKKYSAARASTIGANKGKYNFFIAPSAEDFTGLLYKMLGKGKKGDAQMAFLKANLLDPYDRAESAVTQAKISAANDFKALKTNLKSLPKSLSKPTGIGGFTYSHAIRTAVWTAQGMEIPGLSKRDVKELTDFVKNDPELRVFSGELLKIQKGKPYPKPTATWLGGNITTDIIGDINKVNRAEYQQEWRENIDIIFSDDNLNKMEAAYGTRWREALEDSIRRMKSGSNRPIGGNRTTEGLLDWLNNSVGAVMFLNTRSALLQTISAVNFINWGDNNIVKAGAAFANQKQFWSDFMTLMNSDYLVERRNGLKINVSESEIADAVRDSKNKPKAAIAFLLSKGFVMTRIADSFAIASGGSTFYRNRVKSLVAKGMDKKAAEAQAFSDFRQIAEESQQSSNPNKISQQQASAAGRVILAWANTPMQYARIQKKAGQDLINGRGDWKTNVSKIVYYGAVQNLIFNSLQQAVFALGFGEDDEEKDQEKDKKLERIANGMIDSQLKGLGIFGAATVALKNTLQELGRQNAKSRPRYEEAVADLLSFSPPLGSKISKMQGGFRSFSWNMKEMKEKGLSLDNPAYLAGAQVVTGLTNLPLDRVAKKINNLRGLVNERSALWQRVALGLGWSTWDLGLGYYGGFDAAKVLTPEEELTKEVTDMKKLTKTKEQVDMLLDFGLTKKEIKALGKEEARVRKIIELQRKDKK